MNRLCASLSVGLALMASVAMGAQSRSIRLISQQGPTPITQSSEVPPAPLPSPTLSTPTLSTNPEVQFSGPVSQMPVVPVSADISLFPCVRYRSTRNIAPCAVPVIVQVPDPCTPRDRCGCTVRPCVNVEICVPTCGCPDVCVTRNGNKTRYDYGKYAVNVISLNGRIVVDYDD